MRELLAGLFGMHLSLGTLLAWVQQGAVALEPVEAQIKAALETLFTGEPLYPAFA